MSPVERSAARALFLGSLPNVTSEAPVARRTADLLPPPGAASDPEAALLFLLTTLEAKETAAGESRVRATESRRDAHAAAERRAREEAARAAERGGFFDFFSKDLGILGLAGAVMGCWTLFAADIALHKLDVLDEVKVDLVDLGAWAIGGPGLLALDVAVRKLDLAPAPCRQLLDDLKLGDDVVGLSDSHVQEVAHEVVLGLAVTAGAALTLVSAGSAAGLVVAGFAVALSLGGHVVARTKALDGLLGENASAVFGVAAQVASAALTVGGTLTGQLGAVPQAAPLRGMVKGADGMAHGADRAVLAVHAYSAARAGAAAERSAATARELRATTERLVDGLRAAAAQLARTRTAVHEVVRSRERGAAATLRA